MAEAKISSKNQIVLPKEARDRLGVKPGDTLILMPDGDGVFVMKKPVDVLASLRGIAKGLYPPDYLEKERQNWSKQESKELSGAKSSSHSTQTSSSTTSRKTPATARSPKTSSGGSKRRAAAR